MGKALPSPSVPRSASRLRIPDAPHVKRQALQPTFQKASLHFPKPLGLALISIRRESRLWFVAWLQAESRVHWPSLSTARNLTAIESCWAPGRAAQATPARTFELVSTQAMPSGSILSTYKVAGLLKTG